MSRGEAIRHQAEAQALELLREGLVSSDPRLATICEKLSSFQPLLSGGANFDEGRARELLRTGFGLIRFQPNPNAPDEAEVLRLLDSLATKLSSMGRMLLGFLK